MPHGNALPAAGGSQRPTSSGRCSGTLYSVGRVNYSTRDSRLTDSIVGFEYDAGCWIGRIVAERLSTGRSEATTRLLVQLELVGLSRLGSNPLKVLKDNVPGYQLLREEGLIELRRGRGAVVQGTNPRGEAHVRGLARTLAAEAQKLGLTRVEVLRIVEGELT